MVNAGARGAGGYGKGGPRMLGTCGCGIIRAANSPERTVHMTRFRAGVDIGGTFTDVVFLGDDGTVLVRKVASTPDDYARAVLDGISLGIEDLSLRPDDIGEVSHGYTVATNAILEGKGERTALITTEGFRDVLELARIRTPRLYDLYYQKPPALVERRLRFEVSERMTFQGEVLTPLSESSLREALGPHRGIWREVRRHLTAPLLRQC